MKFKILVLLLSFWQIALAQKPAVFSEDGIFFDIDGNEVFRLEDGQQFLLKSAKMQNITSNHHYRGIAIQPPYAILNTSNEGIFLINAYGKKIADFGKKYEMIAPFIGGKAIAYRRMSERPNAYMLSYIDSLGNPVCAGKEFWEADPFYNGMAMVQLNDENGDCGYIDESGEMKINLTQRNGMKWNVGQISPRFINGLVLDKAYTKKNGNYELTATYLLDKKGNIVRHLEKDFANLMPWSSEKDSSKMGTYSINREDNGYISLLIDNTKHKGNSTIYLFDESLNVLFTNTYKTIDFQHISNNPDFGFEYCKFERELLVKGGKYYTPSHLYKKEYLDIKGNVLYKNETPFPENETKQAGYFKENRIDIFDKNHLIFYYVNDNSNALDTISLFNLATQSVVFKTLGNSVNRLSDSLIAISSGLQEHSLTTSSKTIYNLKGKQVYKTPLEKQDYYFHGLDNLANLGDINYRNVYSATFSSGDMNLISAFPNIKRLKLICHEETIFPEDLSKLRHLEYLFIYYGNQYHKRTLPESFRNLRKLKHLCISGVRFENLKEILEALPNLQTMEVQMTYNMNQFPKYWASIRALEKELPNLQFIFSTPLSANEPEPDDREISAGREEKTEERD